MDDAELFTGNIERDEVVPFGVRINLEFISVGEVPRLAFYKNGVYWSRRGAKAVVRKYIYNRLKRGHIKRGPCAFCANPGTQFHHYDYDPRSTNYDDVCDKCHHDVHEFLKTMKNIFLLTMGYKVK